MLVAITMGILSAVALVVVMARINLNRFMGYPVLTDVGGSALFAIVLSGTLTGMLVAVIAGLTLSAFTWFYRSIKGFERFSFKNGWSYYPPRRVV